MPVFYSYLVFSANRLFVFFQTPTPRDARKHGCEAVEVFAGLFSLFFRSTGHIAIEEYITRFAVLRHRPIVDARNAAQKTAFVSILPPSAA